MTETVTFGPLLCDFGCNARSFLLVPVGIFPIFVSLIICFVSATRSSRLDLVPCTKSVTEPGPCTQTRRVFDHLSVMRTYVLSVNHCRLIIIWSILDPNIANTYTKSTCPTNHAIPHTCPACSDRPNQNKIKLKPSVVCTTFRGSRSPCSTPEECNFLTKSISPCLEGSRIRCLAIPLRSRPSLHRSSAAPPRADPLTRADPFYESPCKHSRMEREEHNGKAA